MDGAGMFYSQYRHVSDIQKHAMNGTSVTMCDYCAIFDWSSNQLPYREAYDYCATFGRGGLIFVLIVAELYMYHMQTLPLHVA